MNPINNLKRLEADLYNWPAMSTEFNLVFSNKHTLNYLVDGSTGVDLLGYYLLTQGIPLKYKEKTRYSFQRVVTNELGIELNSPTYKLLFSNEWALVDDTVHAALNRLHYYLAGQYIPSDPLILGEFDNYDNRNELIREHILDSKITR